ncbi:hypothetical protein LPB72_04670 [Hydrogenophaga crassostreae]|uniref:Uncharacterized protein n=1 Tax=Hydrogenophaga crassostreae TaxID=1763535 RepID=A0A162Z215_9BURK|nr:hypothetical protein LPB072_19880 [Hydrogenophaga crassostreae]OAD43160.1 hypothetical protein LPB72_04670 [Hydrogenophaga crassostreae]
MTGIEGAAVTQLCMPQVPLQIAVECEFVAANAKLTGDQSGIGSNTRGIGGFPCGQSRSQDLGWGAGDVRLCVRFLAS